MVGLKYKAKEFELYKLSKRKWIKFLVGEKHNFFLHKQTC